jgi:ABC-2 type transport system permease protein
MEARQLWFGWRGLSLLLALSLLLGAFLVALAADPEITILSQRRMIDQTILLTLLVAIVAVVLLGADSFSGMRDQRTLESLLLTPVPRSQLVAGKLLAIFTLWLGMVPIAVPYVALVARGTDVIPDSILLLVVSGTLLVGLAAGVGILVSVVSPTNLVSFAAAFGAMLLLAAPIQLPGRVKELPGVEWLLVANPVTAVTKYQAAVLEGGAWSENATLLVSPVVVLAVVVGVGVRQAGRRLTLQGGFES